MKFTFGIATTDTSQRMSGNTNNHVSEIIESIRANNIPSDCYEIIVVGGSNNNYDADDVTHIEFDDFNPRPGWFTRKKNIMTEKAKYDNIVFTHDYLVLDKDWYKGFWYYFDHVS